MRLRRSSLLIAAGVIVATLAGIAPSASADTPTFTVATNNTLGIGPTEFLQVSCTSATFCVAIGDDPGDTSLLTPLTESFNGSLWTVDSPPFTPTQVSCAPETTFCMALGSGGFESFDGSSWAAVPSSVPVAQALSCSTATYCLAVGETYTYETDNTYSTTSVETWDGAAWTSDPAPPNQGDGYDFGQVSCPTTGFCEVAGQYNEACIPFTFMRIPSCFAVYYPAAEIWDGSSWSSQTINPVEPPQPDGLPSDGSVLRLSCSSATFCMTVANTVDVNGSPIASPTTNPNTIEGLSCYADDNCLVNEFNSGVIASYDGSSWTDDTAPSIGTLVSVSCPSGAGGFCVAVGSQYLGYYVQIGDAQLEMQAPLIETTGATSTGIDAGVSLSVSPSTPTTGPVTYTVSLSGSPVPTGWITVYNQGQTCTSVVSSGQASCTFTDRATTPGYFAGAMNFPLPYVEVDYTGDGTYSPEVTQFTQPVGRGTPSVTVDPPVVPPLVAGNLAYQVKVTGLGATPTGTVSVSDGTHSCSATLRSGSATCALPETVAGAPYTVTATYNGDVNYLAATGSTTETFERPSITSANAATAVAGTPFTFTATAYSSAGTPVITSTTWPLGLHLVNNGDGTATIEGTPAAAGFGLHNVTLSEKVAGMTVAHQVFHLTVDSAPAFIGMPVHTVTAGRSFTYPIVTRYGYPTPTITTVSALPAGVTFTDHGNGTASLAGMPSLTSGGIYHLTFTATNGIGIPVNFNFTLTVRQPPVITSADTDTITAGSPMPPFVVTATGYPAPTFRAAGLPAGLRLSLGKITGTVTGAEAGTYSVTIGALSVAGTTSQPFYLVVTP